MAVLAGAEDTARVATARVGALEHIVALRAAELAEANQAVDVMHATLEEVANDGEAAAALRAARAAVAMREAEVGELRHGLSAARQEVTMLSAALTTLSSAAAAVAVP